jgi:hypothetical protein
MYRLAKPGAYVWFFVDLSEHRDFMHPHPMTEKRVADLFSEFKVVATEMTPHKAHPKAFAAMRVLFRKPALAPEPTVYGAPRPATVGVELKARPAAPSFKLKGQEAPPASGSASDTASNGTVSASAQPAATPAAAR